VAPPLEGAVVEEQPIPANAVPAEVIAL